MKRVFPWIGAAVAGIALLWPLSSQVNIANNAAEMSGKIVMLADGATPRTVTNTFTFDLDPLAPFAVSSGSAKVTNLDADTLDGIDSSRFGWSTITTTSTGTQHNFAPGITTGRNTLIRLSNATTLQITGIAGGVDGQHLILVANGAGLVTLHNQNASSSNGNRLENFIQAGGTPLAPASGTAHYIYDGTSAHWVLVSHEQGAWITPSFDAATFTGDSSMTWTLTAPDVIANRYVVRGNTVTYIFRLNTTTVGGTPSTTLQITLPNSWTTTAANRPICACVLAVDNGGGGEMGYANIGATTVGILLLDSMAWTAAANTTGVFGSVTFEID